MSEKSPSGVLALRLTIATVSACALAYEVLLMRLFSITQWHHFAYMIISLALLGYGASGTFLALTQQRLLPRFYTAFQGNILLFGISLLLCYTAAQHISFNAEALLWDTQQPLLLLTIYLLLSLPFFFAANAIALALAFYRDSIAQIYASDLLGAGLGSLGIVLLLFVLFPDTALKLISTLSLLAAIMVQLVQNEMPRHAVRLPRILLLCVVALLPLFLPGDWFRPIPSPYKGLPQTLQITGTQILMERSSPFGLLSVVESPVIPFRHAPGLSITATTIPPQQLGVFTDGDAMTVITRDRGQWTDFSYLDQLTSALPYHLGEAQRVLVLGAGGGSEVLQARYHRASHVDAVELNPQMAQLVTEKFARFAGNLYSSASMQLHIADARGYLEENRNHYDVIQLAMVGSASSSSAGHYAMSENYLLTVEAMQETLAHLAPGGYLVLTQWIKLPPRNTLKLLTTVIEALKREGVTTPGQQLILIRSWQTTTLVVKNGSVTASEINALTQFCQARAFDVAYYPGMHEVEANRFNILKQPYFYHATRALLGKERENFLKHYKFDLQPATDDKPYFSKFIKWQTVPEILALRKQGGMSLLESGYLVLVATLLQAMLISVVLILLPLWFYKKHTLVAKRRLLRLKVLVYFSAIGLAFLFLEIALIQKFSLFLSHPIYAVAVVLSSFLIFAGAGSAWSMHLKKQKGAHPAALYAVTLIVLIGGLYIGLLGSVFESLMSMTATYKVPIAIILIAPMAFAMGMPFPLALGELGNKFPSLIPWAWAVNGCASVISAVLATLLAIHYGFSVVVMLALALYLLAAITFPRT